MRGIGFPLSELLFIDGIQSFEHCVIFQDGHDINLSYAVEFYWFYNPTILVFIAGVKLFPKMAGLSWYYCYTSILGQAKGMSSVMSEIDWKETSVVAVSQSSELVIPARTDGARYQIKRSRFVPAPMNVSPDTWMREVAEICDGMEDVLLETLDANDSDPTEIVAEGWIDVVIDSRIPLTNPELEILMARRSQ